jgi:hypothetical protein
MGYVSSTEKTWLGKKDSRLVDGEMDALGEVFHFSLVCIQSLLFNTIQAVIPKIKPDSDAEVSFK